MAYIYREKKIISRRRAIHAKGGKREARKENNSPEDSFWSYRKVGSNRRAVDSSYGIVVVLCKGRDAGNTADSANAFVGGDYVDDLEALREDVAIQMAIGENGYSRSYHCGRLLQAILVRDIFFKWIRHWERFRQRVYKRRPDIKEWTIDVNAKVHVAYGRRNKERRLDRWYLFSPTDIRLCG